MSEQRIQVPEQVVEIIACTERDILWLDYCQGCLELFPDSAALGEHIRTCIAYRNSLIEEIVERQRRDDEERLARQAGTFWQECAA